MTLKEKIAEIINTTPTPDQMKEVTGRSISTYISLKCKAKQQNDERKTGNKESIGYEYHIMKWREHEITKLLKENNA